MERKTRNRACELVETVTTVRGEGDTKPVAKRVAIRRAKKAAGGKDFDITIERYTPHGSSVWRCWLTIQF